MVLLFRLEVLKLRFHPMGLIFLVPIRQQQSQMVLMYSSNVLDFDIHLDWISLAKPDARLRFELDRLVDWNDLDGLFGHAVFPLTSNVAIPWISSREIGYRVLRWFAASLVNSAIRIGTNATNYSQQI